MTAFGDAGAVAPEVNHTLMVAGDLGASLVEAAAGYESVADMLIAELTAMGLTTSTTAMVGWQGPGGEMMEMSAAEFMEVCAAASAWIRLGQIHAAEVAAAHTAAVEQMISAEACVFNRTTQAALVSTNAFGWHTPAIIGLDAQYYGHFWVTNAVSRTQYGGVVTTALGAISVPPPLSPTASNPLGPALGVAQDVGQTGGQSAFQAGAKTMTTAADGQSQPTSILTSMAGQAGSLFGQVGSTFGQFTSAGQQLPSMLGQAPQMFSGMLGPLTSMNGLNGAMAGGLVPEAAAGASMGGLGAAGGGGGGLLSGSSALSSTFVRPASSFSTPSAPTLPGGWQSSAETAGESSPRPAGVGGGGLYGAPAAVGREGGGVPEQRAGRTMQVVGRPGSSKGERQRV